MSAADDMPAPQTATPMTATAPLVIWLDPRTVTLQALPPGAHWARRMRQLNPLDRLTTAPLYALWRRRLVFGGDWDLATQDFQSTKQWRLTADLAAHREDYRASEWYRRAVASLERHGSFRHKSIHARSLSEIDHLFETLFLPLLDSMRQTGYQPGRGDLPLGLIDREGRVLKSEKGRHRFAAALVAGVRRFPLQIAAIHRDWAGADRGPRLAARVARLGQGAP